MYNILNPEYDTKIGRLKLAETSIPQWKRWFSVIEASDWAKERGADFCIVRDTIAKYVVTEEGNINHHIGYNVLTCKRVSKLQIEIMNPETECFDGYDKWKLAYDNDMPYGEAIEFYSEDNKTVLDWGSADVYEAVARNIEAGNVINQ